MLSFSEQDDGADGQEEALLEGDATFVVDGIEVNPAQRGYTAVHNYALYFWRPYLGNTAFALWELLVSFCYGDRNTAYPSIARLARMITNSDHSRAVVTGRTRKKTCGVSEIPRVCSGALDVLRRERLVQVICQGTGRMSHYTFRICKTLPVLRPEQVARLSPALRHDHALWLQRHGVSPCAYQQAFAPAAEAGPSTPHAVQEGAYALGTRPYAQDTRAYAPDTRGCVAGSTNNPQEQSPEKHWWQDTLTELRPQLTRDTFEMCLSRTRVRSFQEGVLTLQAASPLVRDYLQYRLAPLLQRTLHTASQAQVQEVVFE